MARRLDWEKANRRERLPRLRRDTSREGNDYRHTSGWTMAPLKTNEPCDICICTIRARKNAWTNRAGGIRCCQCGPHGPARRGPRPHGGSVNRHAESLSTEARPSEAHPDGPRPGEALSARPAALAEPGFVAPIIVGGQIRSYALIAYGHIVELLMLEELENWGSSSEAARHYPIECLAEHASGEAEAPSRRPPHIGP
jgi:hypothetical protein